MGEKLSQQSRHDEISKDLRAKGHYYEPGLITSKKIIAGSNIGNVLFGDPYEGRTNPLESFRHSKVGKVIFRSR